VARGHRAGKRTSFPGTQIRPSMSKRKEKSVSPAWNTFDLSQLSSPLYSLQGQPQTLFSKECTPGQCAPIEKRSRSRLVCLLFIHARTRDCLSCPLDSIVCFGPGPIPFRLPVDMPVDRPLNCKQNRSAVNVIILALVTTGPVLLLIRTRIIESGTESALELEQSSPHRYKCNTWLLPNVPIV
jgi:hypothetical protein